MELIARYTTGHTEIMGTRHPIVNLVYRFRAEGSRRAEWTVVFGVVNGIGDDGREYPTRRAAIAAASEDVLDADHEDHSPDATEEEIVATRMFVLGKGR